MSRKLNPELSDSELSSGPRRLVTVAWASFLAASATTMLFFAFVDPSPVVAILSPTAIVPDRMTLYSLGFLFFWSSCAGAAALTAWLLTPPDTSS